MLRQLKLKNFRCFEDHTVVFDKTTVVVGKNNAGKSTLVEALQLLSLAVNRKGGNFVSPPQWLGISRFRTCIAPKVSRLDFNLETIFHRYGDPPAEITGSFSDDVTVTVYLGQEERIYAFFRKGDKWITSPAQLINLRLPWIYILPQVGPLQLTEPLLTENYIDENLYSRLASRHFRNQIFRNQPQFAEFKSLAELTWHGLQVKPVERKMTKEGTFLEMQVRDGDFVAEVGSMGHGLQMWLQTIWFVSRTPTDGTIVLDEPDVYMHPDLQRKLFRLVNGRYSQAILATHSVEIMAEAEPDNILIIDKRRRRSHYANNEPGVQFLIDRLGGIHNVHLALLFSARKFLFVEGKDLAGC